MKVLYAILFACATALVAGAFVFLPPHQRVGSGGLPDAHAPPPAASDSDVSRPSELRLSPEPPLDYTALREAYKGKDVTLVPVHEKLIALTFDGGGNAAAAERIAEMLSRASVGATFFLTQRFMEKFPDAVRTIAQGEWEIANHTVTHRDLSSAAEEETVSEVKGMEEYAKAQGVRLAPFFRFPYGAYKKGDVELVNGLGYISVRWTVDSWGWQGKVEGRDAQFVADRVLQKAAPGAIVLMHLGSAQDGSTLDADALAEIIRALSAQGYRFVSLSELFQAGMKMEE